LLQSNAPKNEPEFSALYMAVIFSKSRATVAQSWRMTSNRHNKIRKPLDSDALNRLALHYVGRYATTGAKLKSYLRRKVQERGWADGESADIDAIVARCAALGYVDDRAFAETRAASLGRRGYGGRRIGVALQVAGIDRDLAAEVMPDDDAALMAAETYARRKRIGKYGDIVTDPKLRQRQFAAMLRAGHSFDLAKRFTNAVSADAESEGG
jgi:regulatory protein